MKSELRSFAGSEGATESQRYGYRVCDYVWALILAMRGQTSSIPSTSAERDTRIAELRARGAGK